ncbi:MAG: Ppx/GppA family phosphatase [Proteobacteria bacterium]|nr:Ppx/GppA family phosphatase [Pseudomonadota bacterium]
MPNHAPSHNESVRLAAIDCGSNAIRMVIADARGPDELSRIAAERVAVRLGRGAFTRGELDGDTMEQAVQAMAHFRQLFDHHGVRRYRAVATSATRTSQNRDVFLHRLYHEAGIELDVIDGEEEARLVRKAVMNAFSGQTQPTLVLDLGGGSLEVNLRSNAGWRGISLPVGTVRLVETFGLTGAIGHDEAGMVRRYAATLVQTIQPRPTGRLAPAAACGGNAEALARLFGNTGLDGMAGFDLEALERALPSILDAGVEERMTRFNVRRDRAEVMGVAALVLATVSRALQITRLTVPGVGIRDALLLEMAEAIADETDDAEDAQGKALLTAARTFAQRVGHDLAHGENVRKLARSMFDQLRDVHGLPDDLGVVLEIAALLHDIGEVVNARSHHKHSEYMIRWGRIPGLDSPYREIVAALARTHRKSPPDVKKHLSYAELPKNLRQVVRKLAAILRLADGLDTEHRQSLQDIVVSRLGDTIALDLLVASEQVKRSINPEPLLRKAALFEEEFGYRVTFTIGTPEPVTAG